MLSVATRSWRVVTLDRRAMGTHLRLALVGARPGAVDRAAAHVTAIERRWSRFRPSSELARLNEHRRLAVSDDTVVLVTSMIEAWRVTAGLCDASVGSAIRALGYVRTFGDLAPTDESDTELASTRCAALVPGLADVEVHGGTVTLPRGVMLDPGGIGKGLAADLVASALVDDGWAAGALVSLGGDLRVVGDPPHELGWRVAIEAPAGLHLALETGGLATSSTARRRWRAPDGGTAHHVVDPRTGAPARTPREHATAMASTGWQAEALATAALLAGPGAAEVEQAADAWGGAALTVDRDGLLTIHDVLEERLW